MNGRLFLIPSPVSDDSVFETIPEHVINIIKSLDYFIAEEIRTARRYLSKIKIGKPIENIIFFELNKHTNIDNINSYFNPIYKGFDIGLLSEAGMPCIADPGSIIVSLAHKNNIKVIPLVGPSSIIMALIASGLNGQNFAFHGYLPISKNDRINKIKQLEKISFSEKQTQIFMETPFRNNQLLNDLINICNPNTMLSIASEISSKNEFIQTKTIAEWRKIKLPDLNKKPTVYVLQKISL
jgi:16S rRNA (cytidine1402-2'-O)-methyltransferase